MGPAQRRLRLGGRHPAGGLEHGPEPARSRAAGAAWPAARCWASAWPGSSWACWTCTCSGSSGRGRRQRLGRGLPRRRGRRHRRRMGADRRARGPPARAAARLSAIEMTGPGRRRVDRRRPRDPALPAGPGPAAAGAVRGLHPHRPVARGLAALPAQLHLLRPGHGAVHPHAGVHGVPGRGPAQRDRQDARPPGLELLGAREPARQPALGPGPDRARQRHVLRLPRRDDRHVRDAQRRRPLRPPGRAHPAVERAPALPVRVRLPRRGRSSATCWPDRPRCIRASRT